MEDIFIWRGDTHTLKVFATQGNSLLTLNNYTVYFTVKRNINDTAIALAKSALVPATPSTTIYLMKLTGADTALEAGDYTYEVMLELAGEQMTFGQGKFTIGKRVKT